MPKVMIVDDDQTMVSLLKTLLELDGFEVAGVEHRDAILDDIRKHDPDLVLLDVFLTEADGIELLAEMRNSSDLAEKRVVMTSGMNVSEQCYAAGADAFLLKPYTPDQLITLIRKNLATGDGNSVATSTSAE